MRPEARLPPLKQLPPEPSPPGAVKLPIKPLLLVLGVVAALVANRAAG